MAEKSWTTFSIKLFFSTYYILRPTITSKKIQKLKICEMVPIFTLLYKKRGWWWERLVTVSYSSADFNDL